MPQTNLNEQTSVILAQKQNILNCYFDPIDREKSLEWIVNFIQSKRTGYICTVNVSILMMMRRNEKLLNFVNKASLTVADGQPIIWASSFLGCPLPERVTGIDLITDLASRMEQEKISLYLIGSTTMTVKKAVKNLLSDYPNLQICGFSNGYFPLENPENRIADIKKKWCTVIASGYGVSPAGVLYKSIFTRIRGKFSYWRRW